MQELLIYDAIIKKHYLTVYGLKPDEINKIPNLLLQVWGKISKMEREKEQISGNGKN